MVSTGASTALQAQLEWIAGLLAPRQCTDGEEALEQGR